MSRFRK